MSDIRNCPTANIRSQSYFVARTRTRCWHCGRWTAVLALAVPIGHKTLDDYDLPDAAAAAADAADAIFALGGADGGDGTHSGEGVDSPDVASEAGSRAWCRESSHAILFYVAFLPVDLQVRLQTSAPNYRLVHSETTQDSYWANHCECCGLLLEDHELHCEPEGAFVPLSEAAAADIQLEHVGHRFAAAASGYSLEPEFFECMSRR